MLREVNTYGSKLRGDQTQIGKAFTGAIKELEELVAATGSPSAADIAAIMHKTPTIKAMLLLNHYGKETALKAMRTFPCVPSRCPMQSMEKFMEDLAHIGDLVDQGKITENALNSIGKVFESLGYIIKAGDNAGTVNLNMARGAVGVITSLRRITTKKVISGFEVAEEIADANGKVSRRIPDILTTDGTKFEIKGWKDKDQSLNYLLGELEDEGGRIAGKLSSQVHYDILAKALNSNDKRVWYFADEAMEALKPTFAGEITKKILSDNKLVEMFAQRLKISPEDFRIQYGQQEKLQRIVKEIFGNIS